jgi:DNA-binding CsgD family transcriptional regulator
MMHSNKAFIISKSAVIGKGLKEVISANFKTDVLYFSCFDRFLDSFKGDTCQISIFIDCGIINSKEVIKFLESNNSFTVFQIVNSSNFKTFDKESIHSLDIYSSENEIVNKLKSVFEENYSLELNTELSSREIDVLKLVAQGYSNKEIADKLFITVYTVMSHRKKITEKLGIKSISGLTVYSIINNIIDTDNINLEDLI